jgi:WD40 repeat protein
VLAASSDDDTARIWNAATGEVEIRRLEGAVDHVDSMDFSLDGSQVLTTSNGLATAWGTDRRCARTSAVRPRRGQAGPAAKAGACLGRALHRAQEARRHR